MNYPRAERDLLLLSAATAAQREELRRRVGEPALAAVDWGALTDTLRARRLLTTLGPRIVELAGERADPGFAAAVQRELEAGRRQAALLQLVAQQASDVLAAAGIRSAPLKGPQLSEALHGDPGRRLSSDVDLLVPAAQLDAAVAAVRQLGYEEPEDPLEASGLPQLHFALLHARGEMPPVELHWRIHWYEERFAGERLLPPSLEAQPGWRPERVDELIALLLFYARDGFLDLRIPTDLGAWWDAYGEELDPAELRERIAAYPELAPALRVALRVSEEIVGLPAGPLLAGAAPLRSRERVATRLAYPNPHSSRAQLYADIGLIDGLLSPPGGVPAFVRRQVLPSRDVLEQQARHGSRPRRRSTLGRGAGIVARYGLALTRLLRPAEALPRA
ncbi:MAG TPA: nucleotidyltransferase family protein [Solirubrobacterales bacterium]|nr:nucleotidyltransferase family protein [Solirubrobacterales bacterium]